MGNKKKARRADFQFSESQKRAAGTFKRDAEQAEKLGLAVKRGLRGMIEEDFSQTLQDKAMGDYAQGSPKLSYGDVSTGNLLTPTQQRLEYATRMAAHDQGQNMKFQNRLGYLDLIKGGQGIGQMGMVNLAELGKQQILGEGARKSSDYASRLGGIARIGGAIGSQVATSGFNPTKWDWGGD
tara:strand:- start:249 stop:794 length:546 start_codon:yes stop_codon:yes gene_type:complete